VTPDEVAAALAARTPGPWKAIGYGISGKGTTASVALVGEWEVRSTGKGASPAPDPADARAIVVAVNLADDLWRVAEAAQAQERLTRQFVSMFGGTGRDERTILAALDTLRKALAALAATREEMQ